MIRACSEHDVPQMVEVINDAAQKYRGVIAADRWKEPYMPEAELREEISDGVKFWAWVEEGRVISVMGLQDRGDVALVRHAYTRTAAQGGGAGSKLMTHLRSLTRKPMLIGTWRAATWAIRFYEKRGFRLTGDQEKNQLLKRYWRIPARQVEESVVLSDQPAGSPSPASGP
jgi:N-acetylglutamate synthase-like GNAT family acetyltransferase